MTPRAICLTLSSQTNAMAVRMMEDAGKKVPQLYAKIEAKEEVVLAVLQDVRGVVEGIHLPGATATASDSRARIISLHANHQRHI